MNQTVTENHRLRDTIIIGAGLTGLTTAYYLTRKGCDIEVIEQSPCVGGQIRTYHENGFTFESGPNTGVISHPEVAELLAELSPTCRLETAREASRQRLIWKGDRFHSLPSGLFSAITTPLFSTKDKFNILGEPFRSKGNNPDETIGELVQRRLGISYLHYAVDPFISGVYAGDPIRLVTRHALPKLYQLEQTYGSFILGGIAKSFSHRSERDRLATRKVFSTYGGLSNLTKALEQAIGIKRFSLGAISTSLMPCEQGWVVSFTDSCGIVNRIHCRKVITTAPAFALPSLLPFVPDKQMNRISNLTYAPVMQVSVGLRNTYGKEFHAFGGLVPSCEQKPVLGILFPSACFDNRSPEGGALYSYFLGGTRHPELLEKSDDEIIRLITTGLNEMLDYPAGIVPDLIRIFRHKKAIPQYESSSADRFAAINELQKQYPGLVVAGNLKGGIGMADRIKQAVEIARER